jgi:hypothetical protein
MANRINLNRNDLAKFLPDQRAIRAFEELFASVPTATETNEFESAGAQANAQQALDSIERLSRLVELYATAPAPEPLRQLRYGTFYDTTTQTSTVINTPKAVTFNSTDLSFGVRIGTPASRIYVDSEGIYNFQFSMQLDKTAGGVGLFYLWAAINGINQTNSATQVRLQGNNAESVAAWNFVYRMNAGDYLEFVWSSDVTDLEIKAFTAAPPVPGIPSVILTVTTVPLYGR